VTGFGPFQGVDNNPTTHLMKMLPIYLKDNPLNEQAEIASFTVLETSGIGSLFGLCKRLQQNKAMAWREEEIKVVWLHLGVDSSCKKFALERVAYNEANFKCADEREWQPTDQSIILDSAVSCLGTTLDVDVLEENLSDKGFKVRVSDDPGRFVCNWIYFLSLHFASMESSGDVSLFVHVPPFTEISENKQCEFVRALVEEITEMTTDN